jgi:glycosyltransferase involved in cell wall biosynthesis
MNILYCHRTQGRGAEGVHIREIIKALEELGHKVLTVSPPGVDVFEGKFINDKKTKRSIALSDIWSFISRHTPEFIFEFMEIGYNAFSYGSIKSILTSKRIDFIYERYSFFGFSATMLARKNDVPILMEVNEISGLKRIRGQVFGFIAKYIEKQIFKNARGIIVVSTHLKHQIERMGVDPRNIHIIPNGVNVAEFDPGRIDNADIVNRYHLNGKIVIGFVGGFVRWHNLGMLIDVFSEVADETSKNICMMLVGEGPLRQEIETRVKEKGIESRVILTGAVDHVEIPRYIKSMDICVIPHSNDFRSPIKLFEYMAMAKPVVVPGTEPIESVIHNNDNGIVFRLNDRLSLKEALMKLIEDRNMIRTIGDSARKTIISFFLWKHNARRIVSIFEDARWIS